MEPTEAISRVAHAVEILQVLHNQNILCLLYTSQLARSASTIIRWNSGRLSVRPDNALSI